jgi:hypothetical protein
MESSIKKLINSKNEKSYTNYFLIILRFSSSSKVYSIKIPNTWTVKRLENFIEYSFREEVKNSVINLFFGAKKFDNPYECLSAFLKPGANELNQIIVSVKKNQGIAEMEADKKFLVK